MADYDILKLLQAQKGFGLPELPRDEFGNIIIPKANYSQVPEVAAPPPTSTPGAIRENAVTGFLSDLLSGIGQGRSGFQPLIDPQREPERTPASLITDEQKKVLEAWKKKKEMARAASTAKKTTTAKSSSPLGSYAERMKELEKKMEKSQEEEKQARERTKTGDAIGRILATGMKSPTMSEIVSGVQPTDVGTGIRESFVQPSMLDQQGARTDYKNVLDRYKILANAAKQEQDFQKEIYLQRMKNQATQGKTGQDLLLKMMQMSDVPAGTQKEVLESKQSMWKSPQTEAREAAKTVSEMKAINLANIINSYKQQTGAGQVPADDPRAQMFKYLEENKDNPDKKVEVAQVVQAAIKKGWLPEGV